jgi:hypothetical protein
MAKDGERDVFGVDGLLNQLVEIALGDERVHHLNAGFLFHVFDRLEAADAQGDGGEAFLFGHVAGEGFAEAFGDAVEITGVDGFGGFHLDVGGIAGDGVDA